MKKMRWIGVVALLAMMMSGLVACDSDVPEVPKDPQEPETPEAPVEIEPLPEEFRPVLTDGKRWVVEFGRSNEDWASGKGDLTRDTVCFEVKGDTIIDSDRAKIIVSDKYVPSVIYIDKAFMESDGKVYMSWANEGSIHEDGADEWGLLYDLNLREPIIDPIIGNYVVCKPISRGTVIALNKTRRATLIDNMSNSKLRPRYDFWIEGVGSIWCHWVDYQNVHFGNLRPNLYAKILECYENGVKIFDADEFDESSYTPLEVFAE